MKVSCLRENLERGLATVDGAIAHRATLPITQNVLLCTDQGMLRLSATKLDIAITTWIGGSVKEEGAISVPARRLKEFINLTQSDRIDINAERSSTLTLMQIKAGRPQAVIKGTDSREFPPISRFSPAGLTTKFTASSLRLAINRVAFAAASEESRPILTGVAVRLRGNYFTMVAADGFRLAVHNGKLEQPVPEETMVVIPIETVNELLLLMADSDETVQMMLTPQHGLAVFKLQGKDTVELSSYLKHGTFPDFDRLIPLERSTRAILDRQELLQAVRIVADTASERSNIIRVQIKPSLEKELAKLIISASTDEESRHQEVDIAELEGEEARIAINSRYLLDALSTLDRNRIAIEFTTSSQPVVFKPADSDDYVQVIMPMFVDW